MFIPTHGSITGKKLVNDFYEMFIMTGPSVKKFSGAR